MALIRDVTAKEREIHSSIIVLLDVRKEATMCIIPVVPISKFTRILTSTGKLFAGEGSLQNNLKNAGVLPPGEREGRRLVTQTAEGPFAALSKPIFVIQGFFCSIF